MYEIFTTIAKKYERFNAFSSFGTYKLWLKNMIKMCPANNNSKVIDIAGGTGDVSFALARKKKPAHIELTDFVPAMLDVAKAHYADGKGCGVRFNFAEVDAQDMPYEDNSFDVATMAYGIRNIPDRTKALREINRVLKPGGALVCLEFSTPTTKFMASVFNWYLVNIIPFWGKIITGNKDGFVYLGKSIKSFPDQEGLAKMFEECGFANVSWKNQTFGIAAIHCGTKPNN